jgi:hypothetical protein
MSLVRLSGLVLWALATALFPVAGSAAEILTTPVRTLERPEGDVGAVAFTADGKHVCAGGERGVVYCWDANTGEIVNRVTAHLRAAVFAVATYPLSPFAVHASELGIKFHLVGGHGRIPSFPFKHLQTVLALDFSRDGNHMASADRGGEIIVWDLWTGEPYRRFQAGKAAVNSVSYHPDGNRIAAASDDGKLRVWDTKADKLLFEQQAHAGPAFSVAFSRDGKRLATAGKDRNVRLWDAGSGKAGEVLEGHEDAVNVALFHPQVASLLVSAGDDKTVRLWGISEKKLLQTLRYDKPIYALAWRSDGGMLAVASGGQVRLLAVKGEFR